MGVCFLISTTQNSNQRAKLFAQTKPIRWFYTKRGLVFSSVTWFSENDTSSKLGFRENWVMWLDTHFGIICNTNNSSYRQSLIKFNFKSAIQIKCNWIQWITGCRWNRRKAVFLSPLLILKSLNWLIIQLKHQHIHSKKTSPSLELTRQNRI